MLDLFGVDLPKGETRSNWLRRPLTEAQQRYAALDGAYLLPAYEILQPRLAARGRESWLAEEMEQLSRPERFLPDPETVFLSSASHTLSRRQLGALQLVAAWREREARSRDLPRNFVLHKRAMVSLVTAWPRGQRGLERVKGLRTEDIHRYGRQLLALLEEARQLPADGLPERPPRPLNRSPHRKKVEELRAAVGEWAEELGLPMELIANRKTLEKLARRVIQGQGLSEEFSGWRGELFREALAEVTPGETPGTASP